MVGNISDIKADVAMRQYNPGIPSIRMVPLVVRMPPMAKYISNRRALMYFIRQVQIKRLVRKNAMATMLYIWAVALLMPKFSAY